MASNSFQKEFLASHNAYRALHRTPALTLSGELSASAQLWADKLLAQGTLMHSSSGGVGENLFFKFSSEKINLSGKEAVDSWYDEIKDYDFNSPGFGGKTGHFTQVVWKSSTEVGVGLATNGNHVYVVGQYRPAGNVNTETYFRENVLPKAGREETAAGEETEERPQKKRSCTLL